MYKFSSLANIQNFLTLYVVKGLKLETDFQTPPLCRTLSSRQAKIQQEYRLMYLNMDIVDLMTVLKCCTLPSVIQKWAQSTLNL